MAKGGAYLCQKAGSDMPRFYFDTYEDDAVFADAFGDEFESFEEARAQAISILPDMARDEIPEGDHREFGCDVRDASGVIVYRARLIFRGERSE
jgi:hypothetical protein